MKSTSGNLNKNATCLAVLIFVCPTWNHKKLIPEQKEKNEQQDTNYIIHKDVSVCHHKGFWMHIY